MPSDTEIPMSIAEQAAHWWLTLNSEEPSASDQREFGKWVTQAPECVEAYLRTAMLMKAAKARDIRWPTTPTEQLVRDAKASLGQGLRVVRELPSPAASRPLLAERRIYRRPFVVALATALLAALGIAWFVSASPEEFQTGFGERRSILLHDGSRVVLDTESKIEVQLGNDRRLVTLRAGEALFRVKHDPDRPFEVSVGNVVLRAVGTEFNVDRRDERTTVTMVEGRVLVLPGQVLLGASDRLVVTPSGPAQPQHGVDPRTVTAWTENKLIFEHTPLSDVAEQFNRYNRHRIRIEGAQLRRQQVSGVFQSDDPASFLAFLSKAPGVRIHETADGTHVVQQRGDR
jgi:transmembrane sensor